MILIRYHQLQDCLNPKTEVIVLMSPYFSQSKMASDRDSWNYRRIYQPSQSAERSCSCRTAPPDFWGRLEPHRPPLLLKPSSNDSLKMKPVGQYLIEIRTQYLRMLTSTLKNKKNIFKCIVYCTVVPHHIIGQILQVIIGGVQGVCVNIQDHHVIQSQPSNFLWEARTNPTKSYWQTQLKTSHCPWKTSE